MDISDYVEISNFSYYNLSIFTIPYAFLKFITCWFTINKMSFTSYSFNKGKFITFFSPCSSIGLISVKWSTNEVAPQFVFVYYEDRIESGLDVIFCGVKYRGDGSEGSYSNYATCSTIWDFLLWFELQIIVGRRNVGHGTDSICVISRRSSSIIEWSLVTIFSYSSSYIYSKGMVRSTTTGGCILI